MKLERYLERHKIKYEIYRHPAVFTVKESKVLKQKIPGLHCKCLFLQDNLGKFYLIGLQAEKRLDIKALEKHFNVKKIRFGSEEDLAKNLRLKPGSVSIFGMINSKGNVRLLLEETVWKARKVGFHPNVNTATLVLTHTNLEKYYYSLNCEKEIISI